MEQAMVWIIVEGGNKWFEINIFLCVFAAVMNMEKGKIAQKRLEELNWKSLCFLFLHFTYYSPKLEPCEMIAVTRLRPS